jgi:ABC-type transporter Mla subunit MlaD
MTHRQHEVATFAAKVVSTREFRSLLGSLFLGALKEWGDRGKVGATIARHAARIIARRQAEGKKTTAGGGLQDLLRDPAVLESIMDSLPQWFDALADAAVAMAASLENAPREQQRAFIEALTVSMDSGRIGTVLSSLARTVDALHKSDPTIVTDKAIPLMERVLAEIDFGELQAILNHAESDVRAFGIRLNDLLFTYPAKLILLLSAVPGMANHLLHYLADLARRFNDLPADILTDLILSFFKAVDAKSTGQLLHNLAELIRQVHTGSALIGDAGTPLFPVELARKATAVLAETDRERLFKAGKAIVEGQEALVNAWYDAAGNDPAFPGLSLRHTMIRRNANIRMLQRRMDLLEDADGQETAIAAGLSEWGASEFAELVNSVCRMANQLHQHSPDTLPHIVAECVNALDLYEIEESAQWIARDLSKPLRPVIQAILPTIVREAIDCLEKDTGENGEQIEDMRQTLRRFILQQEAP